MCKDEFDELLLEAVDEVLSSLGKSPKQAIYFYLEEHFQLRKNEIPCNVVGFADAIEKIFGLCASFLEILIMKRLHEKVGDDFKWRLSKDLKFIEYVEAVRQDFLKTKKPRKQLRKDVFNDGKRQPNVN